MPDNSEDKYDYDEIPGFTSYIYKEHRYREPHEYVGAWKNQSSSTAGQKLKALGLNEALDFTQVIDLLEETKNLKDDFEDKYNDTQDDLFETEQRLKRIARKVDQVAEQAEKDLRKKDVQILVLSNLLRRYGAHDSECGYVELMNCGRILDVSEEEACTCGYIKNLKNHAKNEG